VNNLKEKQPVNPVSLPYYESQAKTNLDPSSTKGDIKAREESEDFIWECEECGIEITERYRTCPKCGVMFEEDHHLE